MTHEGQAVAAAAGYTMASKNLGFFFGSHVGTGNAMSNTIQRLERPRPAADYIFGRRTGRPGQGLLSRPGTIRSDRTQGLYHVDRQLSLPEDMTGILRRAMKFAFGPPSGPVTLAWGAGGRNRSRPRFTRSISPRMRYKSRAQSGSDRESRAMAGGSRKSHFCCGL